MTGFFTRKELVMNKRTPLSLLTLVLAAWVGASSMAQTPAQPKTREQVKSELKEAIRTGEMPANDESGRHMHDVYPSRYPPQPVEPCKTREQVKAELAEAIRTGNMPANDESGCRLNQVNPSRYPPQPVAPGKSRQEVKAELQEAIRTGNMPANDETGRLLKEVNPSAYPRK
jgi:Domain of unknown function (DUF4148)